MGAAVEERGGGCRMLKKNIQNTGKVTAVEIETERSKNIFREMTKNCRDIIRNKMDLM